jgi:hypothetical protein
MVWWGNLRERDHWGDQGVDGRIILRWIFRKCDWGYGLCTGFWWRNLRERDHCGDQGVDERIILRWIFRKCDWGMDCVQGFGGETRGKETTGETKV